MDSGETPIQDPTGVHRLGELDSLRGLAALSVVLLHFYERCGSPLRNLSTGERPLLFLMRPLYSGAEAVTLFFVLSGLVLSLPYLRGKQQPYPRYLVRRVFRIYGPYLVSLLVALAGSSFWCGRGNRIQWDMDIWSQPVNAGLVVQHLLFIGRYDWTRYNFVLWSLIQETRISIVFPVIVYVVMRLGTLRSIALCLVVSSTAFLLMPPHYTRYDWTRFSVTLYLTTFFILGILLASNLAQLRKRWDSASFWPRICFGVVACILYTYGSDIVFFATRLLNVHFNGYGQSMIVESAVSSIGTAGLIVVVLNAKTARSALNRPLSRSLGQISYSLYLVHPLVLIALTLALGNRFSLWIQFGLYLMACVAGAWLFYQYVESRFIALSRKV